jgi:CubicO group peptidase (beta-lactamase class C family)
MIHAREPGESEMNGKRGGVVASVVKQRRRGTASIACMVLLLLFAACSSRPNKSGGQGKQSSSRNIPTAGNAELAAILAKACLEGRIPAMSAAVVTSRGLQKVAVAGVRKWGTDVPATLDDLWHIGSDTKIMTSALAAMMVERGKLRWSSTVSEVFPELAPSFSPELKDVSLLQLLSHRAGLPANLDYAVLARLGSVRDQRIGAVEAGLSKKPLSAPGSEFLYSNLGYIIAGAMIERVGGTDWEKAIEDSLFTPLGMASAGFGGLGTQGRIDQPWGHGSRGRPAAGNGPDFDNPAVLGPAGRVHCTIQDWAVFIADQLRGARGESGLLKPESYRMLQTAPYGVDYALGWAIVERDWAGGKAFTHTGSNTMYLALAWLAPRKDFAILVCTNEGLDSFESADAVVGQVIKKFY